MSSTLASLGWDEFFAAEFAPLQHTHFPARVARIDRGAADLRTATAGLRADIASRQSDVAVGDWVAVDESGITQILRRRTAIVRAAASGESRPQTLVANVDTALIAVAAFPRPRLGHIERLVALVWDSGATPSVVVTKSDLSAEPRRLLTDVTRAAPGCDVHLVSAHTGEGVDALDGYDCPGRTLCLIGKSGAGKSTLANALIGAEHMEISEVRRDGKGRHTTTHRELVDLPGGGVLIDTPGLRSVGVWLEEDGRSQTFPEIEALTDQCRFRDCAHDAEPGCAVLAAVETGAVHQRRLESWRKLGREAEWVAARQDARLQRARAREWRRVAVEMRNRVRP
ncbi:MAG TPA: ribosome small subunit-dependent GTPase A [Mycobacteriales bacterium]|nr:ribosome small subunit-dependent GTPase A [Mycobacteriales bacterium]